VRSPTDSRLNTRPKPSSAPAVALERLVGEMRTVRERTTELERILKEVE